MIVALGMVAGVLTYSGTVIPVLGGYQENVQFNQVPKNVRLSIEAIQFFGQSMTPTGVTQLTESRQTFFSQPIYHVEMIGTFSIQQSLPHQSGQKFPQIHRLLLTIPQDDSYVSLQGYDADKRVYEKQHLPVLNQNWTFTGSHSPWQATYTVQSSDVLFPSYSSVQIMQSHYILKYLGPDKAVKGTISYKFGLSSGDAFTTTGKLPPSGIISGSAGSSGGIGAQLNDDGDHGTVNISWVNKKTEIQLKISKKSSGHK